MAMPQEPSRAGWGSTPASSTWLRPAAEAGGLASYLKVLRQRWPLVLTIVLFTLFAAVGYLLVAEKTYKADADLLVSPVANDELFAGLPLLRESSDPTRGVETVARLASTARVAELARSKLGNKESVPDLQSMVSAKPVAQSDIFTITAKASSALQARDVANAFGEAVVEDRTARLHAVIDAELARLRPRLVRLPGASQDALREQVSRLETLRAGDDPTVRFETPATLPAEPASPRPLLTLLAAAAGGLLVGIAAAFALHAIDPRVRREEQLRERYRLPILARVPRETKAPLWSQGQGVPKIGGRRGRRVPLAPDEVSPATLEAFRTARAMLEARWPNELSGRSILVTGASPGEGKTTTALNLAASLVLAGHRVILIEADFRRPAIGEALGVQTWQGLGRVLIGRSTLEEALVPVERFGGQLQVLLADGPADALLDALSLPAAATLLEDVERLAAYVVVDSPPLIEVIDALPLAHQVDDVVVAVGIDVTRLPQLDRLAELLSDNGIEPAGFIVVGEGSADGSSYHVDNEEDRAALRAVRARSARG